VFKIKQISTCWKKYNLLSLGIIAEYEGMQQLQKFSGQMEGGEMQLCTQL